MPAMIFEKKVALLIEKGKEGGRNYIACTMGKTVTRRRP